MSYCSTTEVYNACELDSTVVEETVVSANIDAAEEFVDRLTFTTYHALQDSGTAESSTSSTLTDDDKSWTSNAYADMQIWIYSGTGAGQIRKIESNDSDTITVTTDWTTNPDDTSKYRVVYSASDPLVSESVDGTGSSTLMLDNYPLILLESLNISDTDITTSTVYQYPKYGELKLSNDSEKRYFYDLYPQNIDISYWYGVYPLPNLVKRFTIIQAALGTLAAQIGGTYATPSTYTLPEVSVTIGQAYVNIRETFNSLLKEAQLIMPRLRRYSIIA